MENTNIPSEATPEAQKQKQSTRRPLSEIIADAEQRKTSTGSTANDTTNQGSEGEGSEGESSGGDDVATPGLAFNHGGFDPEASNEEDEKKEKKAESPTPAPIHLYDLHPELISTHQNKRKPNDRGRDR